MHDYRKSVNQLGVLPHHELEKDGWKILQGSPKKSLRIDSGAADSGPVVGIWSCTPGIIEMASLPFNEFVTIYQGAAVVTVNGVAVNLEAGDSMFFAKGETVRWDIKETIAKYMLVCGSGSVV